MYKTYIRKTTKVWWTTFWRQVCSDEKYLKYHLLQTYKNIWLIRHLINWICISSTFQCVIFWINLFYVDKCFSHYGKSLKTKHCGRWLHNVKDVRNTIISEYLNNKIIYLYHSLNFGYADHVFITFPHFI